MLSSTNQMGPQFDFGGGAGLQMPLSAPPTNARTRNISGSSTNSLPNSDTQFPFHLLTQLTTGGMDLQNSAGLVNPAALFALGHANTPRLDRSVSVNECSTAQQQAKINAASQQNKNMVNPSRYKTEVCRPFNENGFCKYGEKCQFAHGDHELKTLPRHPKYKTELCRTFHTVGFCPYGPRCHFIHSEDEYKLVEISQMKQQHAAQQAAKEMAQQAAQLQAQQQALQAQLKHLFTQFQQQLATQMVTQGSLTHVQLQQQSDNTNSSRPKLQHSISVHPLMKVGVVPDGCNDHREQLGSTGDSPSDSMSGSPVLSPVCTDDTVSEMSLSDSMSSSSGGAPYGYVASPVSSSADSSFNFSSSGSTGELSPLQMSPTKQHPQHQQQYNFQHIQQQQSSQQWDPATISQLAATLQGMSVNNSNTTNGEHTATIQQEKIFTPPSSSPEHSDTLEAHYRLPVFSKFAQNG